MRPFHKRFFHSGSRRPAASAGTVVRANVTPPLTVVRYKPRRRTKWFRSLPWLLNLDTKPRHPGPLHLKAPTKLPEPRVEKLRAGYAGRLVG
jgi:hypothetical protein